MDRQSASADDIVGKTGEAGETLLTVFRVVVIPNCSTLDRLLSPADILTRAGSRQCTDQRLASKGMLPGKSTTLARSSLAKSLCLRRKVAVKLEIP